MEGLLSTGPTPSSLYSDIVLFPFLFFSCTCVNSCVYVHVFIYVFHVLVFVFVLNFVFVS